MTGRERLLAILSNQPRDRVAWTTLVDERTRSVMPAHARGGTTLDFYRLIGCDVLQFGNYGLPPELRVPSPARLVTPPVETTQTTEGDGLVVRRRQTPWGPLVAAFKNGHPVKYPVEGIDDLRILRNLWAESRYEKTDGTGAAYERIDQAIGDRGLYIATLGPSPVQQLIELDMGLETFYYLLQDYRDQVEGLLDVMHAARMQECAIVARHTPAVAIMPVENTSTTLVSPDLYRRYSLPQIRDYVDIGHRHGRKVILHMCGLLRGLTGDLARTGMDGINALTPPPVGDLPFEVALDELGEDLVILGGVMDSTVFQKPDVTAEEIRQALERIFTPRIRRSAFLLWLGADGLPTSLDRFLVVRNWVAEHGEITEA